MAHGMFRDVGVEGRGGEDGEGRLTTINAEATFVEFILLWRIEADPTLIRVYASTTLDYSIFKNRSVLHLSLDSLKPQYLHLPVCGRHVRNLVSCTQVTLINHFLG